MSDVYDEQFRRRALHHAMVCERAERGNYQSLELDGNVRMPFIRLYKYQGRKGGSRGNQSRKKHRTGNAKNS